MGALARRGARARGPARATTRPPRACRASSTTRSPLLERYFALEDPTRLEPAERELHVTTTLESGLTLRGYVDRLDVTAAGDMRVVDYKTGRAPARGLRGRRDVPDAVLRPGPVAPARAGAADAAAALPRQRRGPALRSPTRPICWPPSASSRRLWEAIRRATEAGDWRPSTSKLCDWCSYKDDAVPRVGWHPSPASRGRPDEPADDDPERRPRAVSATLRALSPSTLRGGSTSLTGASGFDPGEPRRPPGGRRCLGLTRTPMPEEIRVTTTADPAPTAPPARVST